MLRTAVLAPRPLHSLLPSNRASAIDCSHLKGYEVEAGLPPVFSSMFDARLPVLFCGSRSLLISHPGFLNISVLSYPTVARMLSLYAIFYFAPEVNLYTRLHT